MVFCRGTLKTSSELNCGEVSCLILEDRSNNWRRTTVSDFWVFSVMYLKGNRLWRSAPGCAEDSRGRCQNSIRVWPSAFFCREALQSLQRDHQCQGRAIWASPCLPSSCAARTGCYGIDLGLAVGCRCHCNFLVGNNADRRGTDGIASRPCATMWRWVLLCINTAQDSGTQDEVPCSAQSSCQDGLHWHGMLGCRDLQAVAASPTALAIFRSDFAYKVPTAFESLEAARPTNLLLEIVLWT